MKLFGYDFNVSKAANKYLPAIIPSFFQGREWAKRGDDRSLLEAYQSWVYVASSRNSATFADVKMKLFVAKPKSSTKLLVPSKKLVTKEQDRLFRDYGDLPCVRKAEELEEITVHPLLNLITNVNEYMNKTDLKYITNLYQELTGDAYWYMKKGALGVPSEIWPLPPDRMYIIPSPTDFISHYVYKLGARKIRFEVDEIIHFRWPNPNDVYYGASPLQAVAEAFNINQNMNQFENALFTNNARPEGFFTTDQAIDDTSFERLKAEVLEVWSSSINAGKSGLLDNNVKYQPISWKPRELGFLKGRQWTKSEIFEAYGTPLGLFDEKANRANAEAAQYVYLKFGISPRVNMFVEKLNEKVTPLYDEKLFLAAENVVPEDKEFQLKEDTELIKASVRSINEVRAGRGDKPVEGGEEPLVGRGLVPLSQAGQLPAPVPPPDENVEEAIDRLSDMIVERIAG